MRYTQHCCGTVLFDGILVPVQVPIQFRFRLLKYFFKSFNSKISLSHIFIESVWKQVDFNLELFIFSPSLIPCKINISNSYLQPFYTRNWNLVQDHGSGSGSDCGKMIRFRWFRSGCGSATLFSQSLSCWVSVCFYGIYFYGIYLYSALKFLSIDCIVLL